MQSCARCGTSIFETETQCIRCGHLTPAGEQAARARAQAQASMPPPAFLPPPPRLRLGVGKRIAMILLISTVMIALFVGFVVLGEVPAPWTTRSTPLGIASVQVPNRCRVAPVGQRPGTQVQAMDCSLTRSFEIAVVDMKMTSPTADMGTIGRSIVQATLGPAVTSPRPVTTQAGPAFDLYGTGHLDNQAVHFKARIFDIDGAMVIVAGAGNADDDFRDADYERAIRSVHPIVMP